MDLSTIKKKLDNGDYEGVADFEQDIRLMLNNCFTFNSPGTDVFELGKQLERLFDAKWAEMPDFSLIPEKTFHRKSSAHEFDDTEDGNE